MRRTRLNVVPPAAKPTQADREVALGQVIDGDKVMSLPTHIVHKPANESTAPLVGSPVRESRTQRVRRLQEEARALAREQIAEFEVLLEATANMALEIADGGEVYSIGAREICRRLAEELPRTLQTLQIISKKA